jgi:hypothetical protein
MMKQLVLDGFHYSERCGHFVGASAMLCEICKKELQMEEMSLSEPTCSSCLSDYADASVILRACAKECEGEAKYKLWRAARICDSPVSSSEYLELAIATSEIEAGIMKRGIGKATPVSLLSRILARIISVLPINPMRYPESVWRFSHPIAPAKC